MESEHILPTPRRGHSLVSTLSSIPQPKTEPDIVDAPKASKDKPKEASKDKPKAKDEVEIPVQQPPKHVLVMFGGETSLRPRQCSNELFMFDVAERTWHRIEVSEVNKTIHLTIVHSFSISINLYITLFN